MTIEYLTLKPLDDVIKHQRDNFGWNGSMAEVVAALSGHTIKAEVVGTRVHFTGDRKWLWHIGSFETAIGEGTKVKRTKHFTKAFNDTDVHTVRLISKCGLYIWVHGWSRKLSLKNFEVVKDVPVPTETINPPEPPFKIGDAVKYNSSVGTPVHKVADIKVIRGVWCIKKADNLAQGFVHASDYKLAGTSTIAEPPELTDFSTKDVGGGLLKVGVKRDDLELVGKVQPRETPEQYTARTGYRKFKVGDIVIQRDGSREFEVHSISPCGYNFKAQGRLSLGWIKMRYFDLRDDSRINRDSVAGLLLQGVELQFLNGGEWFDVNPNRLTVTMIGRLDFRQKPSTIDYYGTALPKPIDVHKTKVKTVYGISMTNHKVYPCALGTARVNKSKGYGLYWEHESQARQVYDTLMKPFKDVE